MVLGLLLLFKLLFNDIKMAPFVFNWRHLACCDLNGTNFYKLYGRFEEIGLLHVGPVFHWLYEFGLDVLLGIDAKLYV